MNCCGTPQLNYVERIQQNLEDIQELLNAKNLLDSLLDYLNEDTWEFRFISDKDFEKRLKRVPEDQQARARYNRDSVRLAEKIRQYKERKYELQDY